MNGRKNERKKEWKEERMKEQEIKNKNMKDWMKACINQALGRNFKGLMLFIWDSTSSSPINAIKRAIQRIERLRKGIESLPQTQIF